MLVNLQFHASNPPAASTAGWRALDRIAALPVLALDGVYDQAHLLPHCPGKEASDGMREPAGYFHQLFCGGAARTLQQVQDFGGLAALAGYLRLFAAFGAASAPQAAKRRR